MGPTLIAFAVTGSIFLLLAWWVQSKDRVESRLRALGQHRARRASEDDPLSQRVLFPFLDNAGSQLLRILPTSLVGRSRRWLIAGGGYLSAAQFFSIVLVAATLLPIAYSVVVAAAIGDAPTGILLLPVPLLLLGGLTLPMAAIRHAANQRRDAIWRAMPNSLDLLTTCVEAGLSLDLALQRVADRYPGPLSDELRQTLREIGLGKLRRQALVDMAARVELPDLTTFANAVAQSETLGTSIGQVLRTHAGQLRTQRRQRAEQTARRAPAKMVFPLVFLLLPSLFIVTIGPVVLYAVKAFQEN